MIVGILKETEADNRVCICPENLKDILKLGVEKVLVEKGAGENAYYSDKAYEEAGGSISDEASILNSADLILKINKLTEAQKTKLKAGQCLLGQFNPLSDKDHVQTLLDAKINAFSLDIIPRTTRAQAMDILSSQATAAGYRGVLLAAGLLPKFFPMFMTAAGTIKPSRVLILGAGVAGLQSIATARKLGAIVEAFDVRLAAKEEVLSLGAKFVEVEGATDDKSAGGYAVEQSEDYKKRQAELVHQHALMADIIICTAQIPGRKAPLLINKETVSQMRPGSVIVDMAASSGGNCELSESGKTVNKHGVNIIGDSRLASGIPSDASKMFGKNVINFLKILIKEGKIEYNFEDVLIAGTCISYNGEIKSERLSKLFVQT